MTFEQWWDSDEAIAYRHAEDKILAEAAWDAAIEAAAKACEACLAFNEDDPGESAAAEVRKLTA